MEQIVATNKITPYKQLINIICESGPSHFSYKEFFEKKKKKLSILIMWQSFVNKKIGS